MGEAAPRALPRTQTGDVLASHPHRAAAWRDLTGEHVDQCRLPRAVRTDYRAALSFGDLQRDAVERDDATERAAQLAYLDHRVRARSQAARPRPAIPCRAKSTKAMKTMPRIASDMRSSGGSNEGTTRSMSETRAEPAIGPPSVPAPPTSTVTNARTEFPSPASCAETKRVEYADRAPAMPAMVPASTKAERRRRAVS